MSVSHPWRQKSPSVLKQLTHRRMNTIGTQKWQMNTKKRYTGTILSGFTLENTIPIQFQLITFVRCYMPRSTSSKCIIHLNKRFRIFSPHSVDTVEKSKRKKQSMTLSMNNVSNMFEVVLIVDNELTQSYLNIPLSVPILQSSPSDHCDSKSQELNWILDH
jgi:hypothetical protein